MQPELFPLDQYQAESNTTANKLRDEDRAFHDWYRFVLAFPPHLVRHYITQFGLQQDTTILDPFCGTGTTLVEAKRLGYSSIGIEANPMAHFASRVKATWAVDPGHLVEHARVVAQAAEACMQKWDSSTLFTLPPERANLLLKDSISPVPLHKSLLLLQCIRGMSEEPVHEHELLAFARILVASASNLHFGPEVGVSRVKKQDAPVIESWLTAVKQMADDLRYAQTRGMGNYKTILHHADARELTDILKPNSVDAVFTSPPYPNEKDYTRTTRLESVILGFIRNKQELKQLKRELLCSNTRAVHREDDDDVWVAANQEIQSLADRIEGRRVELGKTSGFERLYSRVTKLYFGGIARHLADLRPVLRKGAYLGYVVGDQASYFRIVIRTGQLLAKIAQSLGYELVSIDLFRTRLATATKEQMREEVVVLRWLGRR